MSKRSDKFIDFLYSNSTAILCIACFLMANGFLMAFVIPFDRPIGGHDYSYHYLRVDALKYNIETGNMFSGIDYLYFGGGGYAGSAYPSLFLYIPALLRVMGMSIGSSMSVFIVLCNLLSYCFMYLFMRKISNSPICGSIGAVLYVLSGYRLDNIIERFALGEVQAYVFWPLILYGLYDFIFDKFKKPYIIGIGFAGMLLSHTISTALALGYSVIISLIFIRRILKTPKKLLTLGITAACTVLVTAYYWMPLLELLSSCEMSVSGGSYHTIDYVIPFTGLFKEIVHNGIAGMGFPIFLLCVPRMFLTSNSPVTKKYLLNSETNRRKKIFVIADVSLIIGLVTAVMSTSLVPWSLLSKVLDFMQFPWRFFAPSSLFLIIAGSIYIYYIARYTKAAKTVMMTVTAVALLIAFNHTAVAGIYHADFREDDFYTGNANETAHIGAGEWLPRAAQGAGFSEIRSMGSYVILNSGERIYCERDNGKLSFDLKGRSNISEAKLPFIWYKGYEGTDGNGKKLDINMSEHGLAEVDLSGAEGLITIEHKPTAIKTASYFVSAISVVSLLAVWGIRKYKRPRSGFRRKA